MRKNRIMYLLAAIGLLGGLFSCSGGEQQSQSSSVEIHFWETFGQSILDEMNKKADAFSSLVKTNDGADVKIDFEYQGGYSDISSKIVKSFAAGTTPTISVAYPDNIADYLSAASQYVVNMADFAADSEVGFGKETWIGDGAVDDFVPSFYNEGSQYQTSGLYSLPFMKSTEVLFYNEDLLGTYARMYDSTLNSRTKIDAFMKTITWDQLIDLCQVAENDIKSASPKSNTLEVPLYYDSDANLFISKSYQENIPYTSIDSSGKASADFNNASAKAMVKTLKSEYDAGLITTKGVVGTYGSDYFTQSKCLFDVGSSGGTGYNMPTGDAFDVGICRVPPSNSNPLYVSQGPTLVMMRNPAYTDSENDSLIRYAWKFLKYITSSEINAELCVNGSEGYVPVRESAYQTDFYQEFLQTGEIYAEAADVVKNDVAGDYLTTPAFKGSATARDQVGGIISNVFLDEKTVDDAFQSAYNATLLAM